jgi:methylmalonyl-CoA/ethylmalonyl-CoA epimerase
MSSLLRFDHIGVVVPTLAKGNEHLTRLFDIAEWTVAFEDPVNDVYVQFGRDPSGLVYETIAPRGPDSPVTTALRRGERVLNHVAYLVDGLDAHAARFETLGYRPAGRANPAIAYGGARIQFFLTPLNFLVELVEAPGHEHGFQVSSPT